MQLDQGEGGCVAEGVAVCDGDHDDDDHHDYVESGALRHSRLRPAHHEKERERERERPRHRDDSEGHRKRGRRERERKRERERER